MWTNQLELNDVAHEIGEEVRFNGRFYSNFKSFDEVHSVLVIGVALQSNTLTDKELLNMQ